MICSFRSAMDFESVFVKARCSHLKTFQPFSLFSKPPLDLLEASSTTSSTSTLDTSTSALAVNDDNNPHVTEMLGKDRRHFSSITDKNSFYRIFLIAKCVSNLDVSEYERTLPGIRPERKTVPAGEFEINRLMDMESGWDRIKLMYTYESGMFQDKTTQNLNTMLRRTIFIGLFLNIIQESLSYERNMKKNSIPTTTMKRTATVDPLMPKTVLMAAVKDTSKLAVVAVSLLHLPQTISAYRNKSSVWDYVVSSAFGFGAVGASQGMKACGTYMLGGALLGSVAGFAVCKMLQNAGWTQELRSMERMKALVEGQRIIPEESEESRL